MGYYSLGLRFVSLVLLGLVLVTHGLTCVGCCGFAAFSLVSLFDLCYVCICYTRYRLIV